MQTLTQDGITMLVKNETPKPSLILQVLSVNQTPLETKQKTQLYQAELSDGYSHIGVMIHNIPPQLILTKAKPIVEVIEFVSKGSTILVRQMNLVYSDFIDQIGKPIQYEEYEKRGYQNSEGSAEIFKPANTQIKVKISEKKTQQQQESDQKFKLQLKNKKNSGAVQYLSQFTSNKDMPLMAIRDLYPSIADFKFKGKVINKTPLTQFKKGNGHFFSIDIIDEEGSTIQGTFFNQCCDKFIDIIQLNGVYIFNKGQIKLNRYSSQTNQYQITFENYSQIQEVEDNLKIQEDKGQIKKIEEITYMGSEQKCSILAIVKDAVPVYQQKLKSGDSKPKRTYQLFDETGGIELTLWGQTAEQTELKALQLIGVRNARIGEFQEKKNLNGSALTQIETKIESLQDWEGYQKLLDWLNQNKENLTVDNNQGGAQQSFNKIKFLSEVESEIQQHGQDQNYKKFNEVRVVNISANTNASHYYPSCSGCKKKIEKKSDNDYYCNSCNNRMDQPVWKYIISVKLIDSSGSIWVTFADAQAKELIGVDPQIYAQYTDEQRKSVITDSYFQEHRYLILSQMEEYQGQVRPRHKVIRRIQDNYSKESKEAFDELEQLLLLQ